MTAPADPELLLAAACCRWPPAPTRDAAVRAAARGIDWERFGRVVVRQRIGGMVDAALRAAAVAPPEPVASAIARQALRIVQQNMLAASETTRIVRAIAAAGHPVLAVKGAVLGALAYGTIALKHSKDIDLLILPDQVEPVISLLEALGYRLNNPAEQLSAAQRRILVRYGKDVTLVRRDNGHFLQVELHWRLFDNPSLQPTITAHSPTQDIALGSGMTVPTLAEPDLYIYLVVHGAIDGWSRMKWLADVNALLSGRDCAAIRALHAAAVSRGAGGASAQALTMMHELFGLSLAPEFLAELQAKRHVRMLIAGAYRLMAVRDGTTEISVWRGGQRLSLAMQFLLGRGVRHHGHILGSILYPPQAMYRSSLSPMLYPLYPFVRVPRWIGRSMIRAAARLTGRGKSATVAAKSP